MATGLIGKKLGGRYEIRRLIGEGGMAEVYEAYHPKLDRRVAAKLMHRHLSRDEQFKARFEIEALAMARLKHPHIVQVYDFDYDAELHQYFMIIEYIDGPPLNRVIKDAKGLLPLGRSLKIVDDLANALGYAHSQRMQHRDIKPSNIMLDGGTRTVLMDFGIAKLVQDSTQEITASGAMVGTPSYISPEQASGLVGDQRSDIYALGVLFYQLVTGQLPYIGDSPLNIILKHLHEVPKSPSEVNPQVPPGISAVILRCMAKDPADRYQVTAELLNQLRNLEAAAQEFDQNRALADKIPNEKAYQVLSAPYSGMSTQSMATPSNAIYTPADQLSSNELATDTLTNIPNRTSFMIGVGALAIIAMLALGAFLFSSGSGNGLTATATATATHSPQVRQCSFEIITGEAVRVYQTETSFSFLTTLAAGETVTVNINPDEAFWAITWSESFGFIRRDSITLPPDC